jgi:hypothetical protein
MTPEDPHKELTLVCLGLICDRLGITSDEIHAGIQQYRFEQSKLDALYGEGGYNA